MGSIRICILWYADDMATMAEDEESMRRMIKRLIEYLKSSRVQYRYESSRVQVEEERSTTS